MALRKGRPEAVTPTLLALLVVACIWSVTSFLYPRPALWSILLWMPVQGWFQLNLFNDASETVLLYEYGLIPIYVAFLAMALHYRHQYRAPRILAAAIPFVVWTVALVPHSISSSGLMVTAVGLRTNVFPLPLLWLGYHAFRDREDLERFASFVSIETLVIGVIAALQFTSLVTPWGDIVDVPLGYSAVGALRPPGTFSSPGHLGMYALAMVPLALGFLGLRASWQRRWIYRLGLAGAILALVVNSQRAAVMLLAGCIPIAFCLARKGRTIKVLATFAAVVAVGGAGGVWVVGDAFTNRVRSITDDTNYTLVVAPTARLEEALQQPLLGSGVGTAAPGTQRLDIDLLHEAESYGAALVFESGLPGLMLFAVLIGALLYGGLRAAFACAGRDTALLASSIFAYEIAICLHSWSYDPLHYPPTRILFWFWAGALLALPRVAFRAESDLRASGRRTAVSQRQTALPSNALRPQTI